MNIIFDKICIRNATDLDCAQLAAWWNDGNVMAHAGFPKGIGTTPEKIKEQLATDTDDTRRRLMIEYEGKSIGEMCYYNKGENVADIGIKICDAEYQEKGLGRVILSLFIKELFAMGYKKIVLDTNLKNLRAQHVYELLGFEKVRINRDSWKDQLGELQSAVEYVLVPEQFRDYSITRKYYEAYEERYKTAHQKGVSWAYGNSTPIVMDTILKYDIQKEQSLLEIGCGEGRDAKAVLDAGYDLLATDISEEAISYCRKKMSCYVERFRKLDCLSDELDEIFDFIYAVAVVHMLVLDEDRDGFYRFVSEHLKDNGMALICTMGDGEAEMQSDISRAFEIQEREHETGKMMVTATSCRMVSFATFEEELRRNHLAIIEKGITSALPEFNNLMYAVMKKMV